MRLFCPPLRLPVLTTGLFAALLISGRAGAQEPPSPPAPPPMGPPMGAPVPPPPATPIALNPIEDKSYVGGGNPGPLYPFFPKRPREFNIEILRQLLAREGLTGKLNRAIRQRLEDRTSPGSTVSEPDALDLLNDLIGHEDLSSPSFVDAGFAGYVDQLKAALPDDCRGRNPTLNRLILDHEYASSSSGNSNAPHFITQTFIQRLLATRDDPEEVRAAGGGSQGYIERNYLEFAGSALFTDGRTPFYAPEVSYSNYRAHTDVSYRHLFGERGDSDNVAARFDLTPYPSRNTRTQDAAIRLFSKYKSALDAARTSPGDADAIAKLEAKAVSFDAAGRCARRTHRRATLGVRAALIGSYTHVEHVGSLAVGGVALSKLLPLRRSAESSGIGFRASAFGAFLDRDNAPNTLAGSSAFSVFWQDRVPFTTPEGDEGDLAKEVWRWRLGVEVQPENPLNGNKTTLSGYIRHQDKHSHLDYTLVLGQSLEDRFFVGFRLAYGIPMGGSKRNSGYPPGSNRK